MKITFTEKLLDNGILVITSWDKDQWCSVAALKAEDQNREAILKLKKLMRTRALLPGSPRNGKR